MIKRIFIDLGQLIATTIACILGAIILIISAVFVIFPGIPYCLWRVLVKKDLTLVHFKPDPTKIFPEQMKPEI